ncbi:MAG TPA: FISUMP domain-containing protein, partial [Bacteroidales bacterium]|nr:FISUMP domain-containing protein [Bacteroidales bacterium]
AENLNYSIDFSWCNGNSAVNCNGYGRLYTWETAKMVCPSGWHLPSKSEFDTLLINVGGSGNNAYHALKEGGSTGFNALLGGWRDEKGQYGDLGKFGHYWCSTEWKTHVGWSLGIIPPLEFSHMRNTRKYWGFSVRCVKD